jgi:FlaA1/EpsC-like NDP-sugar epimerase
VFRDNEILARIWYSRRPAQFLADLAVLSCAFILACMPTINIKAADFLLDRTLSQLPFVVLVQLTAMFVVGAYSIIWRYVGIEDLKFFLKAALISGTVLIALRFLLAYSDFRHWQIPISVILIDAVLGFGGILSMRVLRRVAYELGDKDRFFKKRPHVKRKPALIVGAGRSGAALAKDMARRSEAELEIRGFIDDDRGKKGGSVNAIKVLGSTSDLPRLVKELEVEQIVIAIDNAQAKEIRRILDVCSTIPVKAQIVPSLNEIAHGRVSVSRVRDVRIDDLLGREPVQLDGDNLNEFLSGRSVLVTGAGGSIGSELVRQIGRFGPGSVLLVERNEFSLFQIGREIENDFPEINFVPLLADIGDEPRMRWIFEKYRPEVIFHAAAHKHVPLMELNAAEAVKNNILATKLVASLAGEYGSNDFVLISTDKAVNPTSVMGASKRVAELVVQNLNQIYPTKYIAVRFGNVLGSAGSVVPIFREQIQEGRAVTVTHRDMSRYFMTIPEASQLVMQAGAIGAGGEIFILDMGEPVRILDLAEDMIRLSGLTPYEDVDIRFTGVRKGEKLFEELEITGENLLKTRHPKIYIGKIATHTNEEVGILLQEFRQAVDERSDGKIRRIFNRYLSEAALECDESELPHGEIADNDHFFPRAANLGLAEK